MPDIRGWKEIDERWLEAVLEGAGHDVALTGFRAERVGTGQIGDCVRFTLDYGQRPPGAPDTLVGKFPSDGAESRATGIQLGNYEFVDDADVDWNTLGV